MFTTRFPGEIEPGEPTTRGNQPFDFWNQSKPPSRASWQEKISALPER